jgi:hypothetical protein
LTKKAVRCSLVWLFWQKSQYGCLLKSMNNKVHWICTEEKSFLNLNYIIILK